MLAELDSWFTISESMYSSSICSMAFERIGPIMLPCGTPKSVLTKVLFWSFHSTYRALTNFQYRFDSLLSLNFFNSSSFRIWWSMLSKNPLISPSIIHLTPFHFLNSLRAVWHPLLGLKPWECLLNSGSRTASNTSL